MPFDGGGLGFDDQMHKIDRVIDLLATPDRWCKGTFWTHDGRYCIRGAIMAVDGVGILEPIVLRAIREGPADTIGASCRSTTIPIRITHRSSRCWRVPAQPGHGDLVPVLTRPVGVGS